MLKYTPEQFREMTVGEFSLALDGHAMATGTYKTKGVTWNDVLEAEAEINGKNRTR